MRPSRSRAARFVDALTLVRSVAALMLLAWSRSMASVPPRSRRG